MKETLKKQKGVGQETNRKHDATLSVLERLQESYQILESERDALVFSNTIISRENKYLEGKISELKTQKATTDTQVEELRNRVEELETQNSSLETLLKGANEQKMDITHFTSTPSCLVGKFIKCS